MMASMSFDDFINFKRFSKCASVLPLAIYLPFGILLGILRLFIFLHALLLFYLLPNKFPLKRVILRVMLTVTGIPISVYGVPRVDNKKLMVANRVSNLDPFILALLCRNKVVVEDSMNRKRNPFLHQILLPADENHDKILLKLKDNINDSVEPILFFPERLKTNGKVSLLKFSDLPFQLDSQIQPVTIQTSRFLFDVSVSTVVSSTFEDVFWCLVLPFTLYTVKYLPVTEKKAGESHSEFSCRVQGNMARSMGVTTSEYSYLDVREYLKCRALQNETMQTTSKSEQEYSASAQVKEVSKVQENPQNSEDQELGLMLKQVKDVFPDFHPQCIIHDLKKTRDVDVTITNILEGRVESSVTQDAPPSSASPPLASLSFKAKKFESSATSRHLSFAERKKAMIETARNKYKLKHGLI